MELRIEEVELGVGQCWASFGIGDEPEDDEGEGSRGDKFEVGRLLDKRIEAFGIPDTLQRPCKRDERRNGGTGFARCMAYTDG